MVKVNGVGVLFRRFYAIRKDTYEQPGKQMYLHLRGCGHTSIPEYAWCAREFQWKNLVKKHRLNPDDYVLVRANVIKPTLDRKDML